MEGRLHISLAVTLYIGGNQEDEFKTAHGEGRIGSRKCQGHWRKDCWTGRCRNMTRKGVPTKGVILVACVFIEIGQFF